MHYLAAGNLSTLSMHKILVVEDEKALLQACCTILANAGYGVDAAKNGMEAFDKIDESTYDAVLTDMMLPYATGAEITHKVRATPHNAAAKVVVMSAMDEEDIVYEVKHMGADGYMQKPIRAGELLSKLALLLGKEEERVKQQET